GRRRCGVHECAIPAALSALRPPRPVRVLLRGARHHRPHTDALNRDMITDIASFLRYFEGVNKRALRDIGSLPAAAETWRPPAGEGENAWSIGDLVGHMAASRMFFVRAYCGDGWTPTPWVKPTTTRTEWVAALTESGAQLDERLGSTPDDWLHRRI